MAGTIPLSMTQQFDEFGKPLAGGLLYIMVAGSVATPQNPFQDYGLTILQPNPIPLDAAGRVPQFFLADGFVKTRLVDKNGVQQNGASRDFVLVIGPSSGGGGGGGVDPTTIIQTGMVQLMYGTGILAGFVRANGRTIGNAASGATERANPDTQALWIFLYTADPNLAVSGGRTGVALNDYNANKQLTLPDGRGRVFAGLDDMGSSVAGRLTAAFFGVVGTTLGAVGGLESNLLGIPQIPAHQHDVFLREVAHTHTHNAAQNNNSSGTPGPFSTPSVLGAAATINAVLTGITVGSVNGVANDNKVAATGGGLAHANVQPTMLLTYYIKL